MTNKIRRLSMKYNETEHEVLPVSMNNLDHVRSIITFRPWAEMLNQVSFPALRVLDFLDGARLHR